MIEKVQRRSLAFDWRGWFFFGLIAGGAAFALIAGGPDFHGYGWLTDTFHGSAQIVIAPVLLVAGVLIGYGSKTAGGCTSGNGLSRDLDALAGEHRRHRDLLRHRRRGQLRHRGADLDGHPRMAGGVVGVVFGVTLSWTGITSPDVLREGLLLDNAYLYLVFASAVATSSVGLALLRRARARAVLTGEPVAWTPSRRGAATSWAA